MVDNAVHGRTRTALGERIAVTVAVAETVGLVPPAPVQVKLYVEVTVGVTASVPAVVFVPVHVPEAVHEVALVEVHVRVDGWPDVTEVGVAVRVTVGGCGIEVQTPF